MAENILQVFTANPASSMVSTDLLYLGRSPYNALDDFAITWDNLQLSITKVGTIGTGIWEGSVIGATYGGAINPYRVSSTGPYTTIQSAITAAALVATVTSPVTVEIAAGTYTENLTLADFVNLSCDGGTGSVLITGFHGYASSASGGNFYATGINFTGPSSGTNSIISVTGANTCTVYLYNCQLNIPSSGAASAFLCSNANATSHLFSTILVASSASSIINISAGKVNYYNCFTNIVTNVVSAISGGLLQVFNSRLLDGYVLTNSAIVAVFNSRMTPLNTAVPFQIGGSASLTVEDTNIVNNNAGGFWAAGTGALKFTNVNILGTGTAYQGTLTVTSLLTYNGTLNLVNPLIGTYGGTGVNNGSRTLTLSANSTIDANGSVNISTRPKFYAYLSTAPTNVTGDGTTYTVIFDTATVNVGTSYNVATGVFTAPVTGLYNFASRIYLRGVLATNNIIAIKFLQAGSASNQYWIYYGSPIIIETNDGSGDIILGGAANIQLTASDTIKVTVAVAGGAGGKVVGINGGGTAVVDFSGFLIS